LNSADWDILEAVADGRRYTQQHLYDDVESLESHSADWIRQRVSHLRDNGLLQKVGTSAMYEISNEGIAALQLREEAGGEIETGVEFAKAVYKRAEDVDREAWIQERMFGDCS